jgi:ATP-dependent protease ClpP protease subunit
MRTLRISGVLVDIASADDPDVKAGLVTSCMDMAQAIRECTEDLHVVINSYGGSTSGATEIGVALSEFARRDSRLTVEVGAICGSAAANLLATLPAQAARICHPDSMIMYHSCAGMVEGTPDALRDNADRMDKYNEVIKTKLKERTTLDPTTIDTWFEAGREGWLTGLEAVRCGLADGYTDTDFSPAPILPSQDGPKGWEYAAIAAISTHYKEIVAMDTDKVIKEDEDIELVKLVDEPVAEDLEQAPVAEGAEVEPEQAPVAEGEEELIALKAENEELKKELEALKATCEKLTAGLKAPTAKAQPRKTFAQMVRDIPADLPSREYAQRFTALKKEHKAEYDAYMKAHQTNAR